MRLSKHSALQIVKEISELISQHVNIMDEKGYIIASTDAMRIGTFHEGAKKVIDQELELLIIEEEADYIGAKAGINLPLVVDGGIIGVIGITGERQQVELYGQIIRKMTEILVVDACRKAEKFSVEKRRTRYIEEWVLDSSKAQHQGFVDRGLELGIDITLPRRILVMKPLEDAMGKQSGEETLCWDHIERRIQKHLGVDDGTNLLITHNTKMIGIVRSRTNTEMVQLGEDIQAIVEELGGIQLSIGIDKDQRDYTLMHQAYACGKKALIAASMDWHQNITLYEEVTLELFINEVPRAIKEEFVEKVFGKISESKREEMINVIEALVACDGSINLASEVLYMHKNTLQYKMNRMCEKTGYDPRKLKDIPIVYIGMLFYKDLKSS
ncbi:MAG: sugar diacid recognition domain-containing protein [Cellulosilyticaceae bacterium]